jgi:predicted CXXCH cytochrome family protein
MRRALLALGALAAASCTAYWVGGSALSDRIRVPHDVHRRAKVDCITCHEEVYDAKDLSVRGLPNEAKCLECHREKKEKGECGFCHDDVRNARPFAPRPTPELHLDHAAHIERVKEDCSTCHKALPSPRRAAAHAPAMAACLGCHEHKKDYDEARCTKCHTDLSRYPLKPVADFSHRGDFLRNHAAPARSSVEACAQCHDQSFCADCHTKSAPARIELLLPERVDRNFLHRNDFLSRHALEAAADPSSCQRCHGPSFCTTCHEAEGLTPATSKGRDPHPPGWMLRGSATFHGPAARRDIASCAACHDQGPRTNCIGCHKVGGPGGNPHPPGWSDRHGGDEKRRNGMCLYCHL